MLRFSYLPSDFHPMLLLLGEAEDLRRLATLLRLALVSGEAKGLETASFAAPSDTSVIVIAGEGPLGLRPDTTTGNQKSFRWMLDADLVRKFAAKLEALGAPGRKAGSEELVADSPGETPVKVSRGEFTDDFLLPVAVARASPR
jgi:hypothetical protein